MELRNKLANEVAKAVVGADQAIDQLLIALLVGGHVLLEGVPGTAKTLLVRATSQALGIDFRRVQFTPDMMPSDLTGTNILRDGDLQFRPGPIFTNILLADEINRTPPKTQSALLEVMEERSVTVDGDTRNVKWPFFVAATQNPVEYEGTYPLPEAQLDRFLFKIDIDYPPEEAERRMMWLHHTGLDPSHLDSAGIQPVVSLEELQHAANQAKQVEVSSQVANYMLEICRRTRVAPTLTLGASPRASAALLHASKASAYIEGRNYVTPDDVARLAPPLLRHRLILQPESDLEGYRTDDVVASVLQSVEVPR